MTTPAEQRRAARAASESETAARNGSNIAANTAANAGASALLAGLPGPLSGAAMALSEGISAAIKASSSQARPTPSTAPPIADPTKLFAAQLALAIITAIWCFIKSILNPLPIIGMFFPLCSEEDRAANRSLLSDNTVIQQQVESTLPPTVNLINDQQGADDGPAGVTFEQFLARQSTAPSSYTALPRRINPAPPTTPASIPVEQSRNGIVEMANDLRSMPTSSGQTAYGSDIRKLFGL